MKNDSSHLVTQAKFPCGIRIVLSLFSIIVIIISITVMYLYFVNPSSASPKELGIPTLLLFALTVLFVFLIPWEKYGYRIKKIGAIEIEQLFLSQKKELADVVNELTKRLEHLEQAEATMKSTSDFSQRSKLDDLLREYFKSNPSIAISASKLQTLSAQNRHPIGSYSRAAIQSNLDLLLADGYLSPTISRRGNTLYRLSARS